MNKLDQIGFFLMCVARSATHIKKFKIHFYYSIAIIALFIYSTGMVFAVPDPKPLMPRVGVDGQLENTPAAAPNNQTNQVNNEANINQTNTNNENIPTKPAQAQTEIKQANTDTASQTDPKKNKEENTKKAYAQTYADLDMKEIANEMNLELADEKDQIQEDLKTLWQAAITKSETIRFAIYKLSNPGGDEEKKSMVKKILNPLTSVAPLVGMGSSNAVAGGSAVVGGGMLGTLLSDDSAANNHLSRVSDADLVILAQETDNLQQKLIELYYNYLSSTERLKMADQLVKNRYKYYQAAQNSSKETISVADVFYREGLDIQYKTREEVMKNRAALEQLVGNDVLIAVDKKIMERLSKNG